MLAGFHEKFIPVCLHSNEARKPTGKRVARLFLKRCIVTPRVYQPCFAVYIELGLMTNVVRWQSRRGAEGATLQQCIQLAEDLGRAEHVRKVLLKTFAGANMDTGTVVWSGPKLVLVARLEQAERPRFVDFEVLLLGITVNEAVLKLSPRLRRLSSDRNWIVFDSETGQPLLLAPPGRAPRRKKGLVTISSDAVKLIERLASPSPGKTLLVGGLPDVEALDNFLDAKPPPKDLHGLSASFGWTNDEIRLPNGTRFFVVQFRGQAADVLFAWYLRAAEVARLPIASVASGSIRVTSAQEVNVFSPAECHAFTHNVWESSVATRQ